RGGDGFSGFCAIQKCGRNDPWQCTTSVCPADCSRSSFDAALRAALRTNGFAHFLAGSAERGLMSWPSAVDISHISSCAAMIFSSGKAAQRRKASWWAPSHVAASQVCCFSNWLCSVIFVHSYVQMLNINIILLTTRCMFHAQQCLQGNESHIHFTIQWF